MENPDTNDLIEQYLEGSLPLEERRAVEARMAQDAGFRAEVELHRQIQAELADPQKLQLRDIMSDIRRNPPPLAPKWSWWSWGLMAVLALVVLWGLWRWVSPNTEPSATPVEQQEIKPSPSPGLPSGQDTLAQPTLNKPQPIAMGDRRAFRPNPDFEARLGGGIRSTSADAVEVKRPAMGADFPLKHAQADLYFEGIVGADSDTARFPLVLNLYASQSAQVPALQLFPTIGRQQAATGLWQFSARRRARLAPGLYYFTLERQREGALIYVGKFTVGARQ